MGRPKKVIPVRYRCTSCDREFESARNFYANKYSDMFAANNGCSCICKDCVEKIFTQRINKYNSTLYATMIICHMLDVPFLRDVYETVNSGSPIFSIGIYLRQLNMRQHSRKTFEYSIIEGEITRTGEESNAPKDERWSKEEKQIKEEVISIYGRDPFEGYRNNERKVLFVELIKYIKDDVGDDHKLEQLLQLVINNHLIAYYNRLLAKLDPIANKEDYANISSLKKDLVACNDKIAKENEISVRNRSNKEIGRSTLTYTMRDLRGKNFEDAEEDFYSQLTSRGTQWSADMSMNAIFANAGFDENDALEIKEESHRLIKNLYAETDELKEQNRKLLLKIQELGGDLNELFAEDDRSADDSAE